jgi:Short C-terminal domain
LDSRLTRTEGRVVESAGLEATGLWKDGGLNMKKSASMMVVLLLAGTLSGCFSFRGGDETVIQPRSPSTERELADLKAAYDRGIISQQEYNQQRDRILGR